MLTSFLVTKLYCNWVTHLTLVVQLENKRVACLFSTDTQWKLPRWCLLRAPCKMAPIFTWQPIQKTVAQPIIPPHPVQSLTWSFHHISTNSLLAIPLTLLVHLLLFLVHLGYTNSHIYSTSKMPVSAISKLLIWATHIFSIIIYVCAMVHLEL